MKAMKQSTYNSMVLSVIAVCLLILACDKLSTTTPAYADTPTKVIIVDTYGTPLGTSTHPMIVKGIGYQLQ